MYPVIPRIHHVYPTIGLIYGDTGGTVELTFRCTFTAFISQIPAPVVEPLNTVVIHVDHIEPTQAQSKAFRTPELSVALAFKAPFTQELTSGVESLYPVVAGVQNIEPLVQRFEDDLAGLLELTVGDSVRSPNVEEAALIVEPLDPVVPRINYVDPAGIQVQGNAARLKEETLGASRTAPGVEYPAFPVEAPHPVIDRVRRVKPAVFTVDGDTAGINQPAIDR